MGKFGSCLLVLINFFVENLELSCFSISTVRPDIGYERDAEQIDDQFIVQVASFNKFEKKNKESYLYIDF